MAPVSGTCVMQIWHRIPIRTLIYSKPESDVHMTEVVTYD